MNRFPSPAQLDVYITAGVVPLGLDISVFGGNGMDKVEKVLAAVSGSRLLEGAPNTVAGLGGALLCVSEIQDESGFPDLLYLVLDDQMLGTFGGAETTNPLDAKVVNHYIVIPEDIGFIINPANISK